MLLVPGAKLRMVKGPYRFQNVELIGFSDDGMVAYVRVNVGHARTATYVAPRDELPGLTPAPG